MARWALPLVLFLPVFLSSACSMSPVAVKAYTGARRPAAQLCVIESGDRRVLSTIDGKPVSPGSVGVLTDEVEAAETLPGWHTVSFASSGDDLPAVIPFDCKAGHRYRLKAGQVDDPMYGSRKVYMIEDADTKEVVASQK